MVLLLFFKVMNKAFLRVGFPAAGQGLSLEGWDDLGGFTLSSCG